ncbi:MAG: T9SS type A sorting domain-containing protein [Vicingaceae bacterium]
MKRIAIITLILGTFLADATKSRASHLVGGEITWHCIKSGTEAGKLIFNIKLYRACYQGAAILPTSASIANPLYAQYGGVSTIACPLVSSSDISSPCYDPNSSLICGISLANGGGSAVEEHVYISSPVQINGVPSSTGSEFYWTSCCRPTVVSLTGSGYYLRAKMFPYQDPVTNQSMSLGSTAGGPSCYDSSPFFAARPAVAVCDRRNNIYQHNSVDIESDSLSYDWSIPLQSATNGINWKSGYYSDSQLPTKFHDIRNSSPVLDPTTGVIQFTTFSPVGGYHSISVKASSYKNGQKVAEIYRDIVVSILNCDDTIRTNPTALNTKPNISYKEVGAGTYQPSFNKLVKVGQTVELDIKAEDLQFLNTTPLSLQSPSVEVFGVSMGAQPNDSLNCLLPPCAYLDSIGSAAWDTSLQLFKSLGATVVRMKWTPTCEMINNYNYFFGNGPFRTFKFMVKSHDDWCPIPSENVSFFSITVYDSTALFWPILYLDASQGGANLAWTPYQGSNFKHYKIMRSYNPVFNYDTIATISNAFVTTFSDPLAKTDSASTYYTVQINSGTACDAGYQLRTIFLEVDTAQQKANLTWNNPYVNTLLFNAGLYYIYRKDNLGIWSKIDSTSFGQESFVDASVPVNNQWTSYRIESKDPWLLQAISNIDSARVDSLTSSGTNGITKNALANIRVIPNPFRDELIIEDLNGSLTGQPVLIYNMLGEVVSEVRMTGTINRLNVSSLKPGVYFVRYQNGQGEVGSKRLVKSP